MRITHIPTGIVVACQSERSQHKNRATAWNMLRARLYERELEMREAKVNADAASKTDIGWGHQIRSYVLQPYQMVKDLRTGHVSGTPSDVLDGDLDPFMEASLAQRLSAGRWWSRTWNRAARASARAVPSCGHDPVPRRPKIRVSRHPDLWTERAYSLTPAPSRAGSRLARPRHRRARSHWRRDVPAPLAGSTAAPGRRESGDLSQLSRPSP